MYSHDADGSDGGGKRDEQGGALFNGYIYRRKTSNMYTLGGPRNKNKIKLRRTRHI